MVRKLGSGPNPYEARGWANGRQFRRRFRTKKRAEDYERSVKNREERRRNGLPEPIESITYSELEKKFRCQHQTQSSKWHREMTAYSCANFGDTLLRDLRSDDIQEWLSVLKVGSTTKGHILQTMRQILERGVDWGYLARNPAGKRLVKPPKAAPADVNPLQSWKEVKHVAANAGSYAALIVFACATGLRPEEWIALTWADIDLAKRTCRINKVVVDGQLRTTEGKTDASSRTILLQQRAIDALKSLPRPINSHAPIFTAPKGGHINLDNWRRRVWKEALIAAKIDHRPPYQMRHSYATLALAAGADIYWVSQQLGHTNIHTTLKHYARFLASVDERNLRLLDEYAA